MVRRSSSGMERLPSVQSLGMRFCTWCQFRANDVDSMIDLEFRKAPLTLDAANTSISGNFSLKGLGNCAAPREPGGQLDSCEQLRRTGSDGGGTRAKPESNLWPCTPVPKRIVQPFTSNSEKLYLLR